MARGDQRKNLRVAGIASGVAAAMLGLAYASVPLYALFCQTTGFGGTTQRAASAPGKAMQQTVAVRFDANISGALGWTFHAVQPLMTVKVGEQTMAHYRAVNTSGKVQTGTAVFNVTPVAAGAYFNKIECFCFTEQTLKPGESADFPVVYFVDPDMLKDADAAGIKEITLSYTFYPVDTPKTVPEATAASGSITN